VPGKRIGNSSSAAVDALADPGFRIGNSSSTGLVGIGIGAEMVPRMDLCRVLARPAVEPDFPKILGMAVGAGWRSVKGGDRVMGKEEEGGRGRTEVVDKAVVHSEPSARRQPIVKQSTLSRGPALWLALRG
jgi:hypothetical protein